MPGADRDGAGDDGKRGGAGHADEFEFGETAQTLSARACNSRAPRNIAWPNDSRPADNDQQVEGAGEQREARRLMTKNG